MKRNNRPPSRLLLLGLLLVALVQLLGSGVQAFLVPRGK